MKKPQNNKFSQKTAKNSYFKKEVRKEKTQKTWVAKGEISMSMKGIGFLDLIDQNTTIEIDTDKVGGAFHKDTVEVEVFSQKDRRTGRYKGRVIKITNRAKKEFVGATFVDEGKTYISADDKKMYRRIAIQNANNIKPDTKVLVKITEWPKNTEQELTGIVVRTLGTKGEHNAEMESIIAECGFDSSFPAEVEREAENIKKEEKNNWQKNITDRRDIRKTWTCTIDPADAKDFDDAISLKELPNGNYEIGVHIADVSHYVKEGTALDKEAKERAFSVYLVDRTIPMLPEILSNDLCSLNPKEDKLSYSAIFEINKNAQIISRWFGKTVMHSIKRFTYENAQETLDSKNAEYHKELTILNTLAKKMRDKKYKDGAIDFEKDEVKFELDKSGVPIHVYKKTRLDTHKLVEEYMLLANKEVAHFISKAHAKSNPKGTFIYRIHGEPDEEKMRDLSIFLKALGHTFEVKGKKITSKDIANMLQNINGSPEEQLIKTATIRSMAKAIYSTRNIGHFGLAFEYYTHFTSPIRRYPDLLVHRLLENHLKGGKIEPDAFAKYEKIAVHASDREVKAAEAERASIKYKQVEYMQKHIGETFIGTISGVTEWGIYVEEDETKCEGMIRLRDLGNDFYNLDEKNYRIIGEKTGKKFTLGDKVKFTVLNADLDKKTLDYKLV